MILRVLASVFAAAALAAAVVSGPGRADERPRIEPDRYLEHVRFLASDELQGRGNGTPGLEKAAEYIAQQLRSAGLRTSFQPLEIVAGLEVGAGNRLALSRGHGETLTLNLAEDYYPLSVTSTARTAAVTSGLGRDPESREDQTLPLPLVFVGYGISAPSLNYDDYTGVDVAGKAVLVFTHEPQENDAASPFEGKAHTAHASVMQKAMVARGRGARVLLLVEDPAHPHESASFGAWARDPQADEFGIAVLRVHRDRVKEALGAAIDLDASARDIDRDLKPRSRALAPAEVAYAENFRKIRRSVRNVVGVLDGGDPALAAEAVVIGAHYDHLGLGGRHSLAPGSGQIHNGADDNASGTAAMIEVARAAAADRGSFPRTLVFVAFAGEELGLLGSSYYVNHPTVPLERTIAMINLDMVGRPGGRLLVSGLDSTPGFDADLKAAQAGIALEVKAFREGAGVGSSDDTSFLVRRVPSIGFFSGFHADYHRPSDDWEKIEAKGGSEVAKLALALARQVARRSERPEFIVPTPAAHGGSGSASAGSVGGYGPYFGSIPDFADADQGVKFADVREGSPAAQAGFRRGDVMISFAGVPIKTLYDFTFALRDKRPGDKVEVIVLRDGKEVKALVELANRP